MAQLPLDLQFLSAADRDDFIIGDCNRLATTWIDRWPDWPGQYRILNLVGPAASGKSHLAAIWAPAPALPGWVARVPQDGKHLVMDDIAR